MNRLIVVSYRWILNHNRVNIVLRIADTSQSMEEDSITVHRLEMGIVVFLNPYGICHVQVNVAIVEMKHENIFRMRIANGEVKFCLFRQFVQNGIIFAVQDYNLITILRDRSHRQCIAER